jgi:inner membrane protein
MDSLTHTLTGIALSEAGLKRKTRLALWALIIGSNLPDIDIVSAIGGRADYLKYHRGITHSLLGLTVLAGLLALCLWLMGRGRIAKKNAPPLHAKWLWIICWIATGLHVLMDYTNSYGIRPWLPFSGRWVAADIMPIVDPYLLVILVLGLGIPVVLRLVSEEVGAKSRPSAAARTGAIFSLCCLLGIWGIRGLAHRRAIGMLNANDYGQETPLRTGAFPSAINPFDWMGVVETRSSYYLLSANALAGGVSAYDAEPLLKPSPSPALAAARKARTAKIFLSFARFPWATVLDAENGYTVYFRDLRFASLRSGRWGFVVEVELDKLLHVRQQGFSFSRSSPLD